MALTQEQYTQLLTDVSGTFAAAVGEANIEMIQQMAATFAQAIAQQNMDSKLFTRPKMFSGKDEDWQMWSLRMHAVFERLKVDGVVKAALGQVPEELMLDDMTAEVQQASNIVYSAFQINHPPPWIRGGDGSPPWGTSIMMHFPRNDRFELWYASSTPAPPSPLTW